MRLGRSRLLHTNMIATARVLSGVERGGIVPTIGHGGSSHGECISRPAARLECCRMVVCTKVVHASRLVHAFCSKAAPPLRSRRWVGFLFIPSCTFPGDRPVGWNWLPRWP